ncbi:signal peptidase I [Methanofollis aquaemaris]|uniref:Signal peptidase I n=1 Tax=Methanofollis aquaemaris TaxID=126734 RepID=A0A8A3S5D0_9EURY|nr:signal peptidase I [Methanofollis aquaemaris]QSZ66836.1 signal peptidase I [Methanofollis aquaemaris]
MAEIGKALTGRRGVLLLLLVVAAGAILLAAMGGWRVDTVLSGSMEPAIHVGGVVVTRPAAASEIGEGEVITYREGGHLTTHRVVEVIPGPPRAFVTKGDANEDPDPSPVAAKEVVGVVFLHLPFLGYVSHFIRSPPGFVLLIVVPASLLLLTEAVSLLRQVRKGGA